MFLHLLFMYNLSCKLYNIVLCTHLHEQSTILYIAHANAYNFVHFIQTINVNI